jgi:hypothetical protein
MTKSRIYLSSPHMGGDELTLVQDAFATNWIAPLGPHVDAFEREFAASVGCTPLLAGCQPGVSPGQSPGLTCRSPVHYAAQLSRSPTATHL